MTASEWMNRFSVSSEAQVREIKEIIAAIEKERDEQIENAAMWQRDANAAQPRAELVEALLRETREVLSACVESLGMGNQYALGDVGDKDDGITLAEEKARALLARISEVVK